MKLFYETIIILSILSLILPEFCFGQEAKIEVPGTLEELKEFVGKVIKVFLEKFPAALKKVWEEALSIWQKMWNWFKNIWDSYIFPWLKNLWQKITSLFKKEVEIRKPIIEEELKKEKEELKEEAPKVGKSLWERFKELLK